MTDFIDVVARARAFCEQRAIPTRSTSSISADPHPTFGIAFIKVPAEEHVQAIAYGDVRRRPHVIIRYRPLERDVSDLKPFARALNQYLLTTLAADRLPRIWIPHTAALKVFGLLGQRYRTNPYAPATIQQMGAHCRALAEEAMYEGQQIVAIAGQLLRTHAATGQAPIKDQHLGAQLAWFETNAGVPPWTVVGEQELVPAAGLLVREDDDAVERMRMNVKAATDEQERYSAMKSIAILLGYGIRREWDLLVRARRAFQALHLLPMPGINELIRESKSRFAFALQPDSRPPSLARLLDGYEYAADLSEDLTVRGDLHVRERLRRQGRAILATVIAIDQPRPGYKPCTLTLRTDQDVLRIRRGTKLRLAGANVVGRVASVRYDGVSACAVIDLRLETGVRPPVRPPVGSTLDWIDTNPFDGRFRKAIAYRVLRDSNAALAYGDVYPVARPRRDASDDLLAIAAQLRR
jgi:hypothetical protein